MNVLMPQLGETVSEGKIIKWFKSAGDSVAVGDNLCEIETDKVTVDVPALEPGFLQAINVEAGTVAPVGAVIAVIGNGTSAATPAAAPAAVLRSSTAAAIVLPSPAAAPPPGLDRKTLDPFREVDTPRRNFGPARMANGVLVTPLARRLAADAGIDLSLVAGSGPRGRITYKDVAAATAAREAAPPTTGAETTDRAKTIARPEPVEPVIGEAYRSRPHEIVAIDGMRRTIARRLVEAKTTIPHFYLSTDVEIDRLLRLREDINAGVVKGRNGEPAFRLSINDFMIKALGLALRQVPHANAIWAGDSIMRFEHCDIGVAVAIPGGLLTPVIMAAEMKSLSAISNEMKDLAERARSRSLQPNQYQGGSSAISNLGMHGVREFSAIINPPQSTMLAVGAAQRAAVETADGGVAFVSRIALTLSCDHRVVDGLLGAELLRSFKTLVENPFNLLV